MANFCNKCGAPVTGIFCNKCGTDSRLAEVARPASPLAPILSPAAVPSIPVNDSSSPKFCNTCGAAVSGAPFCNKCGANLWSPIGFTGSPAVESVPKTSSPPETRVQPSFSGSGPTPIAGQTQLKGSPIVKILIGLCVVVVAVSALAAGGVYYVVHRVKEKVHEVTRDLPGLGSNPESHSNSGVNSVGGESGSESSESVGGDPCRLLSKEDVSRAIGVQIIRTQLTDGGCSYIATGNQADMTAKHVTAMMAARGADKKTQQMIQGFAGGMFKQFQSEEPDRKQDTSGEVPVFSFSVDTSAAEEQMQLNGKVLSTLGDTQGLPGIGDQAFVSADGMIMLRKGKSLVRIMFMTCPCGTDAVKPLAKEIADAL